MSKLASLAKLRSKRAQSSSEENLPETKKPQLSSIDLLNKLDKSKPSSSPASTKSNESKPLSKLASRATSHTSSTSSKSIAALNSLSISKKSATKDTGHPIEPPSVSAQDVFPEVDYSYPFDPIPLSTVNILCQPLKVTRYEPKEIDYVYRPSVDQKVFTEAFKGPSPDDIVLAAQGDVLKEQPVTLEEGVTRMNLRASDDDFKSALNFYVVGR